MKELTIKELAPYFPYDLKVFNSIHLADFGVCENTIETLVGYNLGNVLTDKDEFLIEYCKPILRPLSELTKPITHNGETFVPIEWLEDRYYTLNYGEQCKRLLEEDGENWINQSDYMLVEHLLEWHFDIFNLIESGLAIDITTLK